MITQTIKTLFASDIGRRIEEVIKVDQTDEAILKDEIQEYVITDAIRTHYTRILDAYQEMPNKPHDGIAIWISGFFGSGKSSFAKMLGLAIENRNIEGIPAFKRFTQRAGDNKIQVLLQTITEKIPTHAVIFDVSTDRGIRSGNQTLTEIMYGLFLQSLGYAKDLDLSELEIALEEKGKLKQFEEEYRNIYSKDWSLEKGKVAFALSEASRVLHSLDSATYPMADSWVKAVKNKADITPGKFAERANELMKRRQAGKSLLFVIDEVGQFVARDVQKMLDLQAVIQNLGVKGRGKHWVVVTSQEKLGELVSGLDDKKIELARLMDRFPQQVHLEPSDISEVTSKRVLAKNAAAQATLGKLYDESRARLTQNTRISAAIRLPELSRDGFIDLYPLLPYQIDLVIQIVSGLRTQGGSSRHVGGANRTIIKLAQQLLINPGVNLADRPLGELVRLDQIYDLVENNIGSEVRAKIAGIKNHVPHPFAQPVAKAICLMQFVQTVHRTAENIAASLHPGVDADSQLEQVREALRQLEAAHQVRLGDDGYRIPTPAEDDWENVRRGITPRSGDAHRIYVETLTGFWQPQPAHTLFETKSFKAGLALNGKVVIEGDLEIHLHLAESDKVLQNLTIELRARSQQERKQVFWAVALNDAIDRQLIEVFRSREILARKEREAKTAEETALIGEERIRMRRHQDELRRLLRIACLAGNVFFRGNDRSPGDTASDVAKSATEILSKVLPEVFDRFKEASAKPGDVKNGLEALVSADNLNGLPSVFTNLGLLREEKGAAVFQIETGPLTEVLRRIDERASYGENASGRYLADEFAKEPFGWEFETVRLFILSLFRSGSIDLTSRGQVLTSATGPDTKEVFSNNNLFRQATFRPKKGIDFEEILKASAAYEATFGRPLRELEARSLVTELRKEIPPHLDMITRMNYKLVGERLPGNELLETAIGEMRTILTGSEENAIGTFNASHRSILDAIKRAGELEHALTPSRLRDLVRARTALNEYWPVLRTEPDLTEDLRKTSSELSDFLARETFFRDFPAIDQCAAALEGEYLKRRDQALHERIMTYTRALDNLAKIRGWRDIAVDQQGRISEPLKRGATRESEPTPISQIRSDRDACESRSKSATAEVHRLLDGERLATVNLETYFSGGIETEEQLDAALTGIREECTKLIGAGKKVILQ